MLRGLYGTVHNEKYKKGTKVNVFVFVIIANFQIKLGWENIIWCGNKIRF